MASTGDFDYTIVGIPDIQTTARYQPQKLSNMVQWLVSNKSQEKIAFAVQVGDLADDGTREDLYAIAARAMSLLDGHIPYTFVPGNHDYDDNCSRSRSNTLFRKYFPYSKYSQAPGFGGAFEEGDMANTYYRFEVAGVKYLVLNLEFGPRMAVIRWAGRICEMYPDHRVIVSTHAYVDPDGSIMDETSRYSPTNYGFARTEYRINL